MSKKHFSKKLRHVIAVTLCAITLFSVSASAMLSTSWQVLSTAEEGCRVECLKNNPASFTLTDFDAALPVSTAEVFTLTVNTLPDKELGTLVVGNDPVQAGQTLNSESISALRFVPNMDAVGITRFDYTVAGEEYYCTVSVIPDGNSAPVAHSDTFHTLMGMSITDTLPAGDDDGDIVTYEIIKLPSKGTLTVDNVTGTFEYAPNAKAKGSDSFTFRAVDSKGNISDKVKVSIKIEKVAESFYYDDMNGHSAHYSAVMLARDNIMSGQIVGGKNVFAPNESITRGSFLLMAMKAIGIEPAQTTAEYTGFSDDSLIPTWIKPYVSCAYENGIISGSKVNGKLVFDCDADLTQAQAVTIISNALALEPVQTDLAVFGISDDSSIPAWSRQSFANLLSSDIICASSDIYCSNDGLTRAQAAKLLYAVIEYMKSR